MNHLPSDIIRLVTVVVICWCTAFNTYSQNHNGGKEVKSAAIDSIEILLKSAGEDTLKVRLLAALCLEYQEIDNETALVWAIKLLTLSENLAYPWGISAGYEHVATANYYIGNYQQCVDYNRKKLTMIKPDDTMEFARTYHDMGNAISGRGNYIEALDYYIKADSLYGMLDDTAGITGTRHNIGVIYFSRKSYDEAMKYYMEVINMVEGTVHEKDMEDTYNNIASVYVEQDNYTLAIEYFEKAIKMYQGHDDEWGSAYSIEGLGEVYYKLGSYDKAVDYLSEGLRICEKYDDNYLMIYCYSMLGSAYSKQGNLKVALAYQKRALSIAEELDLPENKQNVHIGLSETYELMNDYEKSLEHFKRSTSLGDSLLNGENSSQINEMATKYETDKKQNQIEMLSKDNDIKNLAMDRQKIIIWSVGGGFILVIALAFFIYNGYRDKKKANLELERINQEVILKNNMITESINYASRIQKAILPPDDLIEKSLRQSFVLFKPKDIVSGDFYWSSEKNGIGLIAAVDCTGHGVPGAFMSMIGNSLLTEIVNEKNITTPSEVLKHLHAGVMNSLHRDGDNDAARDGMDISFCALNHDTLELQYAGAHNPIYLLRDGEVMETKGDKLFIGDERFGDDYANHKIQLQPGDIFYLFSDGFADQFGGPNRKKFYYSRFQELLVEVSQMEMEEQGKELDKVITTWIGEGEQIDDIMVIGVRV